MLFPLHTTRSGAHGIRAGCQSAEGVSQDSFLHADPRGGGPHQITKRSDRVSLCVQQNSNVLAGFFNENFQLID